MVIGRNVDAPARLLHVQEQVVRRRAADVAVTECLRKEIHAHPHFDASFGCEISGRTIVGEQHRACILRVPQEQVNGLGLRRVATRFPSRPAELAPQLEDSVHVARPIGRQRLAEPPSDRDCPQHGEMIG